jgi:AraC family transcriptional regulator
VLEQFNEAMGAIEDRLGEPIDVAELARIALTSEYHFRRMFSGCRASRCRSTSAGGG